MIFDADAGLGGRQAAPLYRNRPRKIIKEGLSEYFIYTIEGTETIPNGWSKRMRSFEGPDRAVQDPVPLPAGRVRRPAGADVPAQRTTRSRSSAPRRCRTAWSASSATTAGTACASWSQQAIKYVPIGDKIELNLGPDPEVIFELVKLKTWRDNIWMQVHGTDVFRRVDGQVQDRGQQHGGRLGRPHPLRPADPQLHGQADRGGDPADVRRAHVSSSAA